MINILPHCHTRRIAVCHSRQVTLTWNVHRVGEGVGEGCMRGQCKGSDFSPFLQDWLPITVTWIGSTCDIHLSGLRLTLYKISVYTVNFDNVPSFTYKQVFNSKWIFRFSLTTSCNLTTWPDLLRLYVTLMVYKSIAKQCHITINKSPHKPKSLWMNIRPMLLFDFFSFTNL